MQNLLEVAADFRQRGTPALDESAFLNLWQNFAGASTQPLLQAALGGICADRLSWVFVSGYQAAIRQTFGLRADGWLAFAASEDATEKLAGVSLLAAAQGGTLTGCKSWIAAVDHVSTLIVRVNTTAQARYFRVDTDREGVVLTKRPSADFLSDLSEGQACFNSVVVTDSDELSAAAAALFPLREAVAIYAAFCGFVLSRHQLSPQYQRCLDLLDDAQQLFQSPVTTVEDRHRLRALDIQVQQLCDRVEAEAGRQIPGWAQDQRLIRMYSRGVNRRAERD